MAGLTSEQQRVLTTILRVANRRGVGRKVKLAAVETGLVETGLRNLPGGDGSSVGWRQETKSSYPNVNRRNVAAAADRFFSEALPLRHRYATAGQLAQAVQRSAHPERYQARRGEALSLLRQFGGLDGGGGASAGGGRAVASSTRDAGPQGSALGLLQALSEPQPQASSVGLAAPSFSARPALPQTYQAPASGGQPAAKPDISALLQAVQTSGDTGSMSPVAGGESATGLGGGAKGEVTSWAQSRLGHYSESTGKNTGPELDILENRFGMKGQPWCAIFATTAAVHGGASRATRTASVAQIAQWAQEGSHGYQKGVRKASHASPGDLVLFGTSHVGFVDFVDKQGIHTIEGNTRSGKVARVVRSTREITGVAKPKYG